MDIKSLKALKYIKNPDYEYGTIDSNFVYHGFFNEEEIKKLQQEVDELKKHNINVCFIERLIMDRIKPRIYKGKEYKKMYILLEKPVGHELYSESKMTLINYDDLEGTVNQYNTKKNNYLKNLETLASASDEQIMKFITDLYTLYRQGIAYDFNDSHRFYYDETAGFTYLPIGMIKKSKPLLDEFVKGVFSVLLGAEPSIILPVKNDFPLVATSFNKEETIQLEYIRTVLLNKVKNSLKTIGVPGKLIEQINDERCQKNQTVSLELDDQQLYNYLSQMTYSRKK